MVENERKRLNDADVQKAVGGASQPGRQKIGYNVKRGDNLVRIADRFGVSVMDLVIWNNIRNPDLICVGQTLVIYK